MFLVRLAPFLISLNLHSSVARIALVKPEKARNVENMILAAAQRGQITEKVSSTRIAGSMHVWAAVWPCLLLPRISIVSTVW